MFHYTNFGMFSGHLPHDIDGYVPEAEDGPWSFSVDHGAERTHNEDGSLTEYGKWWEEEGFPKWRDEAIKATRKAQKDLNKWRDS